MTTFEPQNMGSLLEKMTSQTPGGEVVFTDAQMSAMVEVAIPRMIQTMPGMAAFKLACSVERKDDGTGWTIDISRP